jgi:hypothetical protein
MVIIQDDRFKVIYMQCVLVYSYGFMKIMNLVK